jgi:hypothetical protein
MLSTNKMTKEGYQYPDFLCPQARSGLRVIAVKKLPYENN